MCGHRYSSLTLSGVRIGEERRNVLGGRQILARRGVCPSTDLVSRKICTGEFFFTGTSTRFTPEIRLLSSLFLGPAGKGTTACVPSRCPPQSSWPPCATAAERPVPNLPTAAAPL